MELNDSSPMPFGKHKGVQMANVPAEYLLWLHDNNLNNQEVKAYIIDNLDVLKAEVKNHQINIK